MTVIANFFIFSLCLLNVFLIDAAQFPGYTRFYLFARGHLEQATPRIPAGGYTRAPLGRNEIPRLAGAPLVLSDAAPVQAELGSPAPFSGSLLTVYTL